MARLRAAITTPQAAAQLREFIQTRLLNHIRPQMQHDQEATVQAGLAAAMLIGVIVGQRSWKSRPWSMRTFEAIIQMLRP